MSSERDVVTAAKAALNRRSFLQTSSGVAAGLAAIAVPSSAVALAAASPAEAKPGQLVRPSGDLPDSPVMAYVHDAEKGDVTVVWGTTERTYRDPVLAKRLLAAAGAQKA
jgi:hypothetical protein